MTDSLSLSAEMAVYRAGSFRSTTFGLLGAGLFRGVNLDASAGIELGKMLSGADRKNDTTPLKMGKAAYLRVSAAEIRLMRSKGIVKIRATNEVIASKPRSEITEVAVAKRGRTTRTLTIAFDDGTFWALETYQPLDKLQRFSASLRT
jgi:hypothetical protein